MLLVKYCLYIHENGTCCLDGGRLTSGQARQKGANSNDGRNGSYKKPESGVLIFL